MDVLRFLNDYADGLQTFVACLAAVLGTCWWFSRRERLPRAVIELQVEHIALDDNKHLISVAVLISNIGHVLVRVANLRLFVLQISPRATVPCATGTTPFAYHHDTAGHQIDWPSIEAKNIIYKAKEQPEFEPGESGPLTFEFLCDELPEAVRVYAHLRNEAKWSLTRRLLRHGEIGWETSRIFNFQHEETKRTGG